MIQCGNGTVQLQGTKVELMADVTVIMRVLMEKNILDRVDLENILKIACMSEDEIINKGAREVREAIALASLLFGEEN